MAGIKVDRQVIDIRIGEAALAVRDTFDRVESIQLWLADHPGSGAGDPLVSQFGYTEDEAYLIRLVFGQLNTIRTQNQETLTLTHKLTGLE